VRSLTLVLPLILFARAVTAQTVAIKEDSPGLLAKAKIPGDSALKVALARVPSSTLKSGEIEKEHGKLVYSFDLAVAGKSGITEVQVDAVTGKVVAVEHESAEDEAKEYGKEKATKPDPSRP
jgi:uncharacterized membrane protein YkoI